MPSSYPTSIDSFTDPTSGEFLNVPSHSTQHANVNDAVEAIETFVGTTVTPNFAKTTSPTFVGTPTTPNAPALTNTTQIANTAFVTGAVATEATNRTNAVNLKANIASPTFTGVPAAPTATVGTNTTQLATTAFVLANGGGGTNMFEGDFVYYIGNYGTVDPTGVVDSTAAILAAIAACVAAGGGIVWLGPGTFKISSVLTFNSPTVSMHGAGVGATILQPTSAITGDTIRVQMIPFLVGGIVLYSTGSWKGFTVDGTNAGAGANGFHYGDIIGGEVDITVHGFTATGSKNVILDNHTNWTEVNSIKIYSYNSNYCVYMEETGGTNSFARTNFDLFLQPWGAGQVGLSVPDNIWLYCSDIRIRGNNWATMIQGRAASSYGGFLFDNYDILFENMTSGTTPIVIAGGNYLSGSGAIDTDSNITGTSSYSGAGCAFAGWWRVTGFSPTVGVWTNGATTNVGGVLGSSIDSSATATATAPTFVSGTALQLDTTSDTMLYVEVTTASSLVIAIGPTSTPATTIVSSITAALGLETIRVPKGWYVKITGTVADLNITAVSC